MPRRNPLTWRYTTLRGLHSNKTTWHQDRDGFLEYFNLENLGEFNRLRRGGASTISTVSIGNSYVAQEIPKAAMDFNWVDVSDPALTYNVRYLMLAGNYSWYTVDSSGNITELTLPTYSGHTIVYPAQPSMCIVKDRIFLCTSARASWQTGTWTVSPSSNVIVNTSAWSADLKHGDPIYINGGKYIADHRYVTTVATIAQTDFDLTTDTITKTAHGYVTGQPVVYANGTGASATPLVDGTTYYVIWVDANHFKVALSEADALESIAIDITNDGTTDDQTFTPKNALRILTGYAGPVTISTKNAMASRIGNMLVYDPNENRTGANKVGLVGAVAPPDQMIYSTIGYYHDMGINGWVWVGKAGGAVHTYCKVRSGNEDISFWEDPALTVPMPIPAKVAVDDIFYIDDVEYTIKGFDTTAALRNIIVVKKNAGDAASVNYDGVDEDIDLIAETQNEIGDLTHRWALFFGELTCDVQYALTYAFYNSKTGHLSDAAPISYLKTAKKKFNIVISQWNDLSDNDPNLSQHYDTVMFFRSRDGAVMLQDTKRIASTTVPGTVIDNVLDDNLGVIYASTAYTNSPPPSLMMIEEFQGRIFGIGNHERNKLFYSADEAQINATDEWGLGTGRAEECWPPINYLIIPSEGGNGTSLKRCGDYLYLGTDNALYALMGSHQLNYSLERIFSQDGVLQQSIVEYAGPLTNGVPGAFFLTKGYRAYVIAPGMGLKEVGYSVLDRLQRFVGYSNITVNRVQAAKRDHATDAIGSMTYKAIKPRNYIAIIAYLSATPRTHKVMIYDIDMNEWYEHELKYPTGGVSASNAQSNYLYGTSVFGYPLPVGNVLTYSAPNYSINLVGVYNDNAYLDVATAYSAYLQTSYLDWDQTWGRSTFKALNRVKIYTAASGQFTLDYYTDENVTPKLTGINFVQEVEPRQEATTKEKVALVQSASGTNYGPGWLFGHSLSAKINFPNAAAAESIEYIEVEPNVQGQQE